MIEIDDVPRLVNPVMVAAFEGWNDAACAATGVVDHLIESGTPQVVAVVDPEEFYDYQVNRPMIGTTDDGHAPDHVALDPGVRRPARPAPSATSYSCAASSRT